MLFKFDYILSQMREKYYTWFILEKEKPISEVRDVDLDLSD